MDDDACMSWTLLCQEAHWGQEGQHPFILQCQFEFLGIADTNHQRVQFPQSCDWNLPIHQRVSVINCRCWAGSNSWKAHNSSVPSTAVGAGVGPWDCAIAVLIEITKDHSHWPKELFLRFNLVLDQSISFLVSCRLAQQLARFAKWIYKEISNWSGTRTSTAKTPLSLERASLSPTCLCNANRKLEITFATTCANRTGVAKLILSFSAVTRIHAKGCQEVPANRNVRKKIQSNILFPKCTFYGLHSLTNSLARSWCYVFGILLGCECALHLPMFIWISVLSHPADKQNYMRSKMF